MLPSGQTSIVVSGHLVLPGFPQQFSEATGLSRLPHVCVFGPPGAAMLPTTVNVVDIAREFVSQFVPSLCSWLLLHNPRLHSCVLLADKIRIYNRTGLLHLGSDFHSMSRADGHAKLSSGPCHL